MKKVLICICTILSLTACSVVEDIVIGTDENEGIELLSVEAEVSGGTSTRAAALDKNNYVGRSVFEHNDKMILTKLRRTTSPIPGFSYTDIHYDHVVGQGQTSGGWNRDVSYGHTYKEGFTEYNENKPERIYWSDAANPHTFIGFSVPQQAPDQTFDWEERPAFYDGSGTSVPVYYGSIGNPHDLSIIDYTNDQGDTPVPDDPDDPKSAKSYKSGNMKIKRDDLLLTYDTQKLAETGGSVAKLYFHHALANVRVIVNIQGFSASSDAADSYSVVSDMILKNMLTMYKWKQMSVGAEALVEQYDKTNINGIYNSGADGTVKCDQKKDMHLWIPRPDGTGTGVGKQFTFYGLAVPTTLLENTLEFEFTVKYPNPMNPWKDPSTRKEPNMKSNTYTAKMPMAVEFRAGYCTTINISLNHSNEYMTVGAEYMDWQFVENPDEGELKKHLTFLSSTDRSTVTIADDSKATLDDATWLYNDNGVIRDIFGNDGSLQSPYTISTAEQLLSFAYEVKSGRHFMHKFVKLDADITLQKDLYDETVSWIGVGDKDNVFNGFFLGDGRSINRLKGEHFFHTVGDNAVIDKLNFNNIVEVQGCGVIAHMNKGLICSCYIDGDVKETAAGTQYTGSIVGTNNSFIIACSHVGKVTGYGNVGGLVGFNNGTVMASYHSGVVEVIGSGQVHPTVGAYGDGTSGTNNSIMFSCYYDSNVFRDNRGLVPSKLGYPFPTSMMQSSTFVNLSDKLFEFKDDGSYDYDIVKVSLKDVLINILKKKRSGDPVDPDYDKMTDDQLMTILIKEGITGRVNEIFAHHFSLNGALNVFRCWLKAIATMANDQNDNYYIDTNCHRFYKQQILFLYQHYGAEHKFVYTPATYPKTQ